MLKRLESIASVLFPGGDANLVLAHGKARYNPDFITLQEVVRPHTAQAHEEALVQCAEWLAQSRKRVFLGQIGVCTVDQVLISVLPVKHKFVRGFGIGKSVLIIDEVHAYDSYMYGLLAAVLEQQQTAGGSAILLSATLPYQQRQQLANTWQPKASLEMQAPYPLITHLGSGSASVPQTWELAA
jgi:CRISPR-associated endonuclease/helicase Cas3